MKKNDSIAIIVAISLFFAVITITITAIVVWFVSLLASLPSAQTKDVISVYETQQETLCQAIEICEKYNISTPFSGSLYPEKDQNAFEKMTVKEREILEDCMDLGCVGLYYCNDEDYVTFNIPRNDVTHQGLIFFLSAEAVPNDIVTFLRTFCSEHQNIEYQKLDDGVYYYFLSYLPQEQIEDTAL